MEHFPLQKKTACIKNNISPKKIAWFATNLLVGEKNGKRIGNM
jgi:hypothetical protein